MSFRNYAAVILMSVAITGCSAIGKPLEPTSWVETRLYFGLGPSDRPGEGVDEAAWRNFLDRDVTTRFPDGLTVLDAYGQWQSPQEKVPERLRSKVLVIDYADNPENRGKIEAIRRDWKQLTGDESVLRVTMPANVSF
jgi:hypothetical protein